jgi:hypothetical protein
MADHLEIEQKFDVEAGFTLPGFTTVPGCVSVSAPVTHHLSATYYDTPGTLLAASKITLRRRTGGTDEGWHLKLPAGAGAKSRLRCRGSRLPSSRRRRGYCWPRARAPPRRGPSWPGCSTPPGGEDPPRGAPPSPDPMLETGSELIANSMQLHW